ncbi:MAG: kinase/pyrophosphorylase [Atopobiaceae bacterium]|jgi:regulator of PEP synthase PpsR (kinase-PPPase family)|nr:kinase/pyrophosphorylase [Atopobiaceae bacterium]NLH91291.1 kinase/pyrophosphorylase [Atopobium sp.]
MTEFITAGEVADGPKPVVFVLSDARGKTAVGVVEAAADQFVDDAIVVKQLGNVSNVEMVCDYLDKNREETTPTAVFHTIADKNLRRDIRRELDRRGIPSVDLLGPAITVIASLTGEEPQGVSGRRTSVSIQELL